jgi:hypothetical protein
MIRLINSDEDWNIIRGIHGKYHADDFPISDFSSANYLSRCIISCDAEPVLAGGVRLITEAVLITDLSKPVRMRRESLIQFLEFCKHTCNINNFNQLHCFPLTSDEWTKHLQKYGFRPTKGQALVMETDNG